MRLTLDELKTKYLPQILDGVTDPKLRKQKAMAFVDGVEIVDGEGNPVEIDTIDLTSMATPETPPAEGESTDATAKQLKELSAQVLKLTTALNKKAAEAGDGKLPRGPSVTDQRDIAEGRKDRGFKNGREFLRKVLSAYSDGVVDKRLKPLQVKTAGSDEQQTGSDPYGGFLVPEAFTPQFLTVEPEEDRIGGMTRTVPMASPTVAIPARTDKTHTTSVSGGLRVYRRAETTSGTTSVMSMERVVLQANTLFGAAYATEELLADSAISFTSILADGFGQEFNSALMNERLNGTGVGEYEGILNAPSLVTVAKETGQAAATIVYENIIKMRSRCWGFDRAVWIYNHDALPQLMSLKLDIGTGGVAMWQTSAREGEPDMLLGRPAYPTEYCQTLGTVGDIMLANWNEYLEGVYTPVQSAESIHVRFLNHERTFKFWTRNDGRAWWRSALTPKKSSNTLSPFVALATRA